MHIHNELTDVFHNADRYGTVSNFAECFPSLDLDAHLGVNTEVLEALVVGKVFSKAAIICLVFLDIIMAIVVGVVVGLVVNSVGTGCEVTAALLGATGMANGALFLGLR